MIDYEQFCRIKHYQDEGLKAGQIAMELGLDSRTVQKVDGEKQVPAQVAGYATK